VKGEDGVMARLPEDGAFSLEGVKLPPGRRIVPDDHDHPVAWVTREVVEKSGELWCQVRRNGAGSGLVPVLLDPEDAADDFGFVEPADPAEIDQVDPAADVLAGAFEAGSGDDMDAHGNPILYRGPLTDYSFAGLAPAEANGADGASTRSALAQLAPAHFGLIAANRPADVLAVTGWIRFDSLGEPSKNGILIGAVLRSFEDRYGAYLLKVGPGAEIRLLVERPPRTFDLAARVAVEHLAFASELPDAGMSGDSVPSLADHLINTRIWSFWWD
jgi:hypothetical protein